MRMREERAWSGHDLRATYGTRLGEADFNAIRHRQVDGPCEYFDGVTFAICQLAQAKAVMLKNQRRHSSTGPTLSEAIRAL